ncbi:MAG: hypothetical protein QM783_11715 [Phycisphaerales bacterium]
MLVSVAIANLLVLLTGAVLLGTGVGSPAWRRWLPLVLLLAIAALTFVGERYFVGPLSMYVGLAVNITLCWLAGLSLQICVTKFAPGLASRTPEIRASRFLKVTRVMLLLPAAVMWLTAISVVFAEDLGMLVIVVVIYALEGAAAVIGLWMLLAAIHWLRLLRFLRPPRTLPS